MLMEKIVFKKKVYALSAICAAAFLAFIVVRVSRMPEVFENMQPSAALSIVLELGTVLALIVMAGLRNSGKPMPRLTLMLAGAAAFSTLSALSNGMFEWLLPLAAGLLPAAYELACYGREAQEQPLRPVKSGLLVAAGVLALLYGGKVIIDAVREMNIYATVPSFTAMPPYQALTDRAGAVICTFSLGVFCLLKDRRTSVMYRLFFVGLLTGGVLRLPLIAVAQLQAGELDFLGNVLLMLPAVVFVLIHAVRHRHEDIILTEREQSEENELSTYDEDEKTNDQED